MDTPQETMNPDGVPKKSPFDDLSREELVTKCKGLLLIAQKAKQAKADLQNEVESYKLQLEKCQTEKNVGEENVRTLQELVDSLTEQKLNFITEVDSAQSKVKALNAKCNSYDEEIKKYKADLIVRDTNIADLTQKLSDFDSEIISLKRQKNRLVEENEQLINQLSELEARTAEFNNIGLQQREQLQLLEEKFQADDTYKGKIEKLNATIIELENKLQSVESNAENSEKLTEYELKIKEITELYETEKSKKEKANVKLRSYKDKILKCAACINQLKNSRFILSKTVKEYSENIPKWRNDIIKASKVLDDQINVLNKENSTLKEQLQNLETQLKDALLKNNSQVNNSQLDELSNKNQQLQNQVIHLQQQFDEVVNNNSLLKDELNNLNSKYEEVTNIQLSAQKNENSLLKEQINTLNQKLENLSVKNNEIQNLVKELKQKNKNLQDSLQKHAQGNQELEHLNLQIKSLESEKAILVKEKLNARDNVIEVENQNKILTEQVNRMKSEIDSMKTELNSLSQEKTALEKKYKAENEGEVNNLKFNIMALQEQYDMMKKEYDDVQDMNNLLKEEVETLKLSLEQPKDDTDNLSELNASLQADIVKLDTKLSAYKQENSALLAEVKESRAKMKEFDNLVADYEDVKAKLLSYKNENTELLNEMKEINQVLKERGEAISKLQKAIVEMERLVETLEKDRDYLNKEKDDLQKKVALLENDLKNAELNTNKNSEAIEQIVIERDNAVKILSEKDITITALKEEIEKLKQQAQQTSSADLPNEDMSTSTISKADEHARMKDLDEIFEEKYTKLRIFALKLKKKLNETTAQLQNAEQDKTKLEKLLSEGGLVDNKAGSSVSKDEVDTSKTEDHANKSIIADLETKVKSLTASAEASEKISAELETIKAELEAKRLQLSSEIEAHKATKDNLEKARRDIKKKNVLSLEMEDYERSMKELTTKMEEKKKKIVQMESTIDTQEGTINAMKTQIKLLEEQIKTEETQNRLIREELQHATEESKEKDNVIQIKNGVISKLEQDLEDEKRKNEESDLEMTSLISEKEKIIMSLGEDKVELNNKVKRLEFKCAELNEKLRITNIELADLKTEYTSYKVRAQAVLRQNQTVDHSQEEQLKEEAAALKAQIDTLTAKLTIAQEQCTEQSSEAESARRRAAEATNEAARAQQRTTRLHADLTRLSQQLESERSQHKLQVSTLTQCYKTQINELETKLQIETENLKKQLAMAQESLKSGKPGTSTLEDANRNPQYMLPIIPKDDGSDGEMDMMVSMIPREEGEGSESAPSPPPSKPYLTGGGSGRSPVPLERLLEEGVPDDDALDTASLSLTPEQEISDLRRRLQAQQHRVKHVTVLLSESERECARMAQLSELLKAELRRVRGTTQNAHNTEYMKNVTLKFLTLPPGDERSRLVPVLQKILTLTSEESQKIQAVAKGLDPNPSKGWGSYLPWPGGK